MFDILGFVEILNIWCLSRVTKVGVHTTSTSAIDTILGSQVFLAVGSRFPKEESK